MCDNLYLVFYVFKEYEFIIMILLGWFIVSLHCKIKNLISKNARTHEYLKKWIEYKIINVPAYFLAAALFVLFYLGDIGSEYCTS